MTVLRSPLRLPLIALGAIVGILSVVGEASARNPGGLPGRPGSCCVMTTPSDCRCCPALSDSSQGATGLSTPIATGKIEVAVPGRACECRSHDGAEPVSKPGSRASERRPERISTPTTGRSFVASGRVMISHKFPPDGDPPHSPLSLLTIRLQI